MYSTSIKVANKFNWVKYKACQKLISSTNYYLFIDGSSSGWASVCVIPPNKNDLIILKTTKHIPKHKNIDIEVWSYILGIKIIPKNSKITVVSDLLGVGAWDIGVYRRLNPEIIELYKIVDTHKKEKNISVTHIHHNSHNTNGTHFSIFNNLVDLLCSFNEEIYCKLNRSEVYKYCDRKDNLKRFIYENKCNI